MKDLCLFAAFIPARIPNSLYRFKEYVKLIQNKFSIEDVFVSIDPDSTIEGINYIANEKFYKVIYKTPQHLLVKSEIAGFQNLLRYLKDNLNILDKYDNVFFIHPLGITHGPDWNWKGCVNCVEKVLNMPPEIIHHKNVGVASLACGFDNYSNNFDKYITLPYKSITLRGLLSLAIIKSSIVRNFIMNCDEKLLIKNVITDLGHHRYYFEENLTTLGSKNGFFEIYKETWYPAEKCQDKEYYLSEFIKKITEWKALNNLDIDEKEYLRLLNIVASKK